MAILSLPQVKIGGTLKPFGGYIYNLGFQVAAGLHGENATTLTLDLASQDGTYQISQADLDLTRSYNVQIGNFNLPMFLKGYRTAISPKGNVLQVTLCDGAFILDKFWVGLDKHAWDNQNPSYQAPKPAWLIVVGQEIHPCDRNWDGKVDFKDFIDPCDPCVTDDMKQRFKNGQLDLPSVQRVLVDCEERGRLEIFDVQYGFDDLIQAASAQTGLAFTNIKGQQIISPNPNYKRKYAGKLRDVLRQWASDFGWTFFFADNSVVFIDVSQPIQATKTIKDFCPNVAEYVEEISLEGTVQGAMLANFRRAGEWRDYTCIDARYIAMAPYGPGNDYVIEDLAITDDVDPVAAGLSLYDPQLRDLYWWFIKNKMYDIKNIGPMVKIPQLGLVILTLPFQLTGLTATNSNPLGDPLLEPAVAPTFPPQFPLDQDVDKSFLAATGLNQWLSQVQTAILADDTFTRLFNLLTPKDQWAFAMDADKYYFFIGYYDETLEAENISDERDFAADFLGRYYIYQPDKTNPDEVSFFEDTRIINDITKCGRPELIEDGRLKFDIIIKDNEGSATYENAPATTEAGDTSIYSRLPWAKWLKIFRNAQGGTGAANSVSFRRDNFKLVTVEVNGDRFFPSPTAKGSETDNQSNYTIQDKALIAQAHSYYLKFTQSKLDSTGEDVLSSILVGNQQNYDALDQSVKDTTKIFLFWGRTCKDTDFNLAQTSTWYHESQLPGYLFDGIPLNQRSGNDLDITSPAEIVYQYPLLRCKPVARWNNLATHYTLKTPAGSFAYTGPSNSTYGLVIQKQKIITLRTERAQYFFFDGDVLPLKSTLSLEVTQQDISDDDINNRIMDELQGQPSNTCKYDYSTIQNLFNERKVALTYRQETPMIKRSITIPGALVQIPSITDGLISIDMSITKEEGVKTTYVLGTLNMIPPSKDIWNGLEFATPRLATRMTPWQTPYQQNFSTS